MGNLTATEYMVRLRVKGHDRIVEFGPYDSLEQAQKQKGTGERIDEFDPCAPESEWIILERTMTEWDPVPNSSNWPEDD